MEVEIHIAQTKQEIEHRASEMPRRSSASEYRDQLIAARQNMVDYHKTTVPASAYRQASNAKRDAWVASLSSAATMSISHAT